jgi:small subunit ribosomal protein S1
MADPSVRRIDEETKINEALDAALKAAQKPADLSLKRQWDDELEAKLEAALQGFDPQSLEFARTGPRTRADDRAHVPKGGVGQEETPGPRQGKVIRVRGDQIFVDLGGKSEGIIPTAQFEDGLPEPGSMIEVVVDRFDPAEGLLRLSRKGAAVEANWENLRKGLIVEARVSKVIKGGLEVQVNGIRGFLPIGQIDINRVEDAAVYMNERFPVLVTEVNAREKNLVVSRRELLERVRAELREKTWSAIEEGQVREGTVRSIKPFGAFIDLGGVDGLLPIGEMSWARVSDPATLLKSGQAVQVKILRIDREKQKVTLGLKQLMASPWDDIEDRFVAGLTVTGKVTRLMEFGAFVELEPGVEGLIHISELGPKRVFRVKDIVEPGQEVQVRILKVDPDSQKISLSLKPGPVAPAPEPEDEGPDEPAAPKPERKVPLKGGLGDRDADPFQPRKK